MKEEINTDFPVHELIMKRWSPRAFANKDIDPEKINSLFEAARWAASSRNSQPWRFIFATKENSETYEKLFKVMVEWNQSWAQSAPLLVLSVAETHDYKNRPLGHALYDLGLAMGNLTAQAASEGLYLHHMGGIDPGLAKELFEIPDRFEAITMIAVGYLGDIANIPADIASDEYKVQERNPQKEFVFKNKFGQ